MLFDKILRKKNVYYHFKTQLMNKEKIYIDKCIIKTINKVKDITIRNRTYHFFNDIVNIIFFDPNNIIIDAKSFKDIPI